MIAITLQQVHEDSRGAIYSIALPQNQELMLFFCKAGHLRGGHSHDVPEVVLILTGHVEYHKIVDGEEGVSVHKAGHVIYNAPGEPHMARFLEDSWVAEWKIGAFIGTWKTSDYGPFRERVRESIK